MSASLQLLYAGTDEHCGCRVEEILVNGIDLHVHYEDGSADAYLDWGDDGDAEFSAPASSIREGRVIVLQWAAVMTSPDAMMGYLKPDQHKGAQS